MNLLVFNLILFILVFNVEIINYLKAFQTQNTPKQNDHCLKNFDLTEYRGIISDIAIWLFQGIIKDFEKKLLPLIVPAMLEHASLPGMSDARPAGMRSSTFNDSEKSGEKITIETLMKKVIFGFWFFSYFKLVEINNFLVLAN